MPILQWRDKSKRALNTIITTAFLATQLLVPMGLSSHASAQDLSPPGNNGTLKVHEYGTPRGTASTATHVCAFNFEGYGFDPGQTGLIKIEPQSPSADTTGSATLSFGPTNDSGFYSTAYINVGAQTLPNGHYKSTLYGKDNAGNYTVDLKAKSKVFWVDCITPVQPTLTTQVSSQNVKAGETVYDTATLTGDSDHGAVTGSVAFSLCGPAQTAPDCTTGGTAVGNAVTVSGGQAVSAGIPITTNTAVGMYCVRADYTPTGSTYLAASHTNKTTECFTVTSTPQPPTPAQPTVDVSTTSCTANTNTSDILNATVTNTADNTHAAVTYTVTVKNGSVVVATKILPNLADGASSDQLHFSNLPAGTYTVTVAGNDGTSATSRLITVNPCPYLPAAPSAVANLVPCTLYSGLNDTVNVVVTNTADHTQQSVIYTVILAGQTKHITLPDGAQGTVSFSGLNTGVYSATVTGNDGTGPITTNTVTVGACPLPAATAQVRVIKKLVPHTDSGRFNLSIDGRVEATAVGDNGTTGYVTVPVGDATVSEAAANMSTDLSNYDSRYVCHKDWNDEEIDDNLFQSGTGTSFDKVVLKKGDKVTCTFTNKRHTTLTIVKHAVPNDPQPFNFTLVKQHDCERVNLDTLVWVNQDSEECNQYRTIDRFQLVDNTNPALASKTESLSPGTYKVTEAVTTGWDLTGLTCTGGDVTTDGASVYVTLTSGANVTCTYTNTKRATVTIVKDAQPDTNQLFNFTTSLGNSFSLMDDGSNSGANRAQFTNVVPGTYTVTEAATGGWKLAGATCGDGVTTSLSNGTLTMTVAPGANLTCTFTNTRIVGDVLGVFTTATPAVGGAGGAALGVVSHAAVAPAQLVNTGQSVWQNVIAGVVIAGAAFGLALASRKQQTN